MCQWDEINLRQLQGFHGQVESYQIFTENLQHMFCKWERGEGGHSVQCRSLCCGKMSITLLQSSGGGGGTLPDLISPYNDKC